MDQQQITEKTNELVQAALKSGKDDDWERAWSVHHTLPGDEPQVRETTGPWRIPFLAWRRHQELRFGAVEAAERSLSRMGPPSPSACGKAPQAATTRKEATVAKQQEPTPGKGGGRKSKTVRKSVRKCSSCKELGHTKRSCKATEEEKPERRQRTRRKVRHPQPAQETPQPAARQPSALPAGLRRWPELSKGLQVAVAHLLDALAGSKLGDEILKGAVERTQESLQVLEKNSGRKVKAPSEDDHVEAIFGVLGAAMEKYEASLPEEHLPDDETFAAAVVEWGIATAINTEVGEDKGDLLQLVVGSLNDLVGEAYEDGDDEEDDGDDDEEDEDGDDDQGDGDGLELDAIPQNVLKRINGFPLLRG